MVGEHAYSPEALAHAVDSLDDEPLGYRINIFLTCFVFPRYLFSHDGGKMAWLKVVAQNRRTIFNLAREAFFGRRVRPTTSRVQDTSEEHVVVSEASGEMEA